MVPESTVKLSVFEAEKDIYIQALENQIAELEIRMSDFSRASELSTCQQHLNSTPKTVTLSNIIESLSMGQITSKTYIGFSSSHALATSLDESVHASVWNTALWLPVDPIPKTTNIFGLQSTEPDCRAIPGSQTDSYQIRRLPTSEIRDLNLVPPSDEIRRRLIEAYLVRIHPRFPFLLKSDIWGFRKRRESLFVKCTMRKDLSFARFILCMNYATGASSLRLTGAYCGPISPEEHYVAALKYVSCARESSPMRNIQSMLFLILYHLRSDTHEGLWQMAGLAMRAATDIGLHRKGSTHGLSTLEAEMRRRLFWTLHYLEGILASTLGKLISLADHDIDQELPYSIEDEDSIATTIPDGREAGMEAQPYTSMTQPILLFQLRLLETKMHRGVYRVDKPTSALLPKLQPLCALLQKWSDKLPSQVVGTERDRILLQYYKILRLLVQPFLSILRPADVFFGMCMHAAGGICQIHKRLNETNEYSHSFVAVHTIFLSGITLLYCLWLGGQEVWSFAISNNIRACNCVLSIMGERKPSVRRYRDTFEQLAGYTMTLLEGGQSVSQSLVGDLLSPTQFEFLQGSFE